MKFKLLGVHVANHLKWTQHVDAILSKTSSRLYFLKQLKRSGSGPEDLLCLHHSDMSSLRICMPSLAIESNSHADEDAWVATADWAEGNESNLPAKDYMLSLIFANVNTPESWHGQLTEWFFRCCVLRKSSCLHYLLPDKWDSVIIDRLCHAKALKSLIIRTEKFYNSLYHTAWTIMISTAVVNHVFCTICCHQHWTLTFSLFYTLHLFYTRGDIHVGGLNILPGLFFFFFVFSSHTFWARWTELNQNWPHGRKWVRFENACPKFGYPLPLQIEGLKPLFPRLCNSVATVTVYIRNKTSYRQSGKCFHNYKGSATSSQNDVNFGPQRA